jgi:superfamily II DNA or RNA helicase
MSINIQQPAMRIQTCQPATSSTDTADGYYRMRPWQERCFTQLRNSHHWIINAPMAAGKSFQICATAADQLRKYPELRVIIAVPQTIIAAGFRKNNIELPDGTRIDWEVQADLDSCRETRPRSTARLLKFLTDAPSSDIMNRVLLCTHATLVRAFNKNKAAFVNVLLVIDEAHHIRHGGEEQTETEIENKLGSLVKYALGHSHSLRLGLTTATFFRGDQASIVPDLSCFDRFELAYDEYLATCQYLRSFSYNFVFHAASFIEPLAALFEQRVGKTLVYIPSVNSHDTIGSKDEDVFGVLRAIAGNAHPIVEDEDKAIMRVQRGEKWIKVVNLVDPYLREQKKAAIIAAHEKPEPDDIDVIVALGIFKEGGNWGWADREIIIGSRGSLTEVVQMVGRLLRDVAGKDQVEVHQVFRFALNQVDRCAICESLNRYLSIVLRSMLLEDVIDPVTLPDLPGTGDGKRGPRINYLREALTESEAFSVLSEIQAQVLDLIATTDAGRGEEFRLNFDAIVSSVLLAHGVHECHEQIAEQVFRMFNRRTLALRGFNVGNLDTDLIKENPFGCLLQYTSDACGIKTFQELRSASRRFAFLAFEEARTVVHAVGLESQEE